MHRVSDHPGVNSGSNFNPKTKQVYLMNQYIIQNRYGTEKYLVEGKSIKDAQKWRDRNLCKYGNWVIIPQ